MIQQITVLVVDDHLVVRAGIVALLKQHDAFRVIGEAGTGEDAVRIAADHRPDIVLMDLQMPVMDGVTATRHIKECTPDTQILVLTTFDDDQMIWGAIEAGAKGYLLKDAPAESLFDAIQQVAAGSTVIAPDVLSRLTQVIRRGGPREDGDDLSPKNHRETTPSDDTATRSLCATINKTGGGLFWRLKLSPEG